LPEYLYAITKSSLVPSFKVSFIHNFNPVNNVLATQATITGPVGFTFSEETGVTKSYVYDYPNTISSVSESTLSTVTALPLTTPTATTPYYLL
jgi:hypothetical protein